MNIGRNVNAPSAGNTQGLWSARASLRLRPRRPRSGARAFHPGWLPAAGMVAMARQGGVAAPAGFAQPRHGGVRPGLS